MSDTPKTKNFKPPPWVDDPRLGRYIDDNALYVLDAISRGHLARSDNAFYFSMRTPFEWTHRDMVEFLLRACSEYGIEPSGFSTEPGAIKEEYEVSILDENGKPRPGFEKECEAFMKRLEQRKERTKKHRKDAIEIFGTNPTVPVEIRGAYKWAVEESERPGSKRGEVLSHFLNDEI